MLASTPHVPKGTESLDQSPFTLILVSDVVLYHAPCTRLTGLGGGMPGLRVARRRGKRASLYILHRLVPNWADCTDNGADSEMLPEL